MNSMNDSAQAFEDRLKSYSESSKSAVRKSVSLGSGAGYCAIGVAAIAVGTTEAEAAVTIVNVNQVLNPASGATANFSLDIAGFGVGSDFEFHAELDNGAGHDFFRMGADVATTLIVGTTPGAYRYVTRLADGDPFPTMARPFLTGGTAVLDYLAFDSTGTPVGDWAGGATGFVGFRIDTGANQNFGWIEIRVDADNAGGEIIRYGIESTPATQVAAGVPETNSLAFLAVGAAGLLGWRQRRQKSA